MRTISDFQVVEPRPVIKLPIRETINLDTLADWTVSHCTKALDGSGIKVTHAGDGSTQGWIVKTFATPIDLSDCHWAVEFTINEGSGNSLYTYIDQLYLHLVDSSDKVSYWCIQGNANNALYAGDVVCDCTPGGYKTSGGIDYTQIKSIRLGILDVAPKTYTPSVTFKKIVFYEKPKQSGIFLFCFDGAYAAQLDAAAYLHSIGLRGFFNVAQNLVVSTDTDRMRLADLDTLVSQDHLVTVYANLSGYWSTLTLTQKKEAIKTNADWLKSIGMGRGSKIVSVPGGGYGAGEEVLWTEGYADMITGRYSVGGWRASSFYRQGYPQSAGPSHAVSVHTAGVDMAIADNAVASSCFHRCAGYAGDITFADFCTIADYVKAKQDAGLIRVLTPDQLPIYKVA